MSAPRFPARLSAGRSIQLNIWMRVEANTEHQ